MQSMYAEDAVFDVSAVFTDVAPVHAQLLPDVAAAISEAEASA